MKLIETRALTANQPSITFSDIPQNFTDLVVKISGRASGGGGTRDDLRVTINGDTGSNYAYRRIIGYDGGTVASDAGTGTPSALAVVNITGNGATANTFSNTELYFSNYTSVLSKAFNTDATAENNSASSYIMGIIAQRYTTSSPITSISFAPNTDFVAGSSISLYGVGGPGDGGPKATGGMITRSGDYWVHTFTASGTFRPTAALSNVDYLVVAGGGGGGSGNGGGGGGAGGYRSSVTGENSGGGASAESKLSLASGTAYTVTVGAGGAVSTNGVNSVFATITSTGGGTGGPGGSTGPAIGGSGGGVGRDQGPAASGAAGTASQGFAGGGVAGADNGGGGGGGAGSVGQNGINDNNPVPGGGRGGAGLSSSITGTAVLRAGGGGGAGFGGAEFFGPGGTGGGGNGERGSTWSSIAQDGTANTGGGGGGGGAVPPFAGNGKSGGSGIVIVRYLA